jgi:hypothetical protein
VVEIKDLQNGAVIHPVAAGIPHLGAGPLFAAELPNRPRVWIAARER